MNPPPTEQRCLLVAITGASGAVYGLRLLQTLATVPEVETHAVVSDAGWQTLRHELHAGPQTLRPLVHTLHEAADIGAGPASDFPPLPGPPGACGCWSLPES